MDTELARTKSGDPIVVWRRAQLVRSGFSPPMAELLADDEAYDLHALIDLVERGCPPDLAARILEPLEPRSAG